MHTKKHLGFDSLREQLSTRLLEIQDHREEGKVDYSIHDCFMSGFAMMYFQDPSLLAFQRRMQDEFQKNNLQTIFAVKDIPQDTQLRDVLDEVGSEKLEEVFRDYFIRLQRGKHLEAYRFLDGKYLITIDGTEYFSSEKIHCPQCLEKKEKKKKKSTIRYHHQILQATLVHPTCKQVIPLAPEAVRNTDGHEKQDCEINAGKRIVKRIRRIHPKLEKIIVGDGLYSKQPFIEEVKRNGMSFIFVAKPDDHKILMEWVEEQRKMEKVHRLATVDLTGRDHIYEWVNNVPINGKEKTCWVNYFEYHLIVKGKVTYHNSWVTDIEVDKDNVKELVKGGRARWKIENEVFNTLKNQGYHIEHNFGHGKNHLSMNFFLLNLLAFFVHQISEWTDRLYQECRKKFSSRKEFWSQLRCPLRLFVFDGWEDLLSIFINPPGTRYRAPP